MENNQKKMIIEGKIVEFDKTPIEELKKIKEQLEKREQEIIAQIEKELENYK